MLRYGLHDFDTLEEDNLLPRRSTGARIQVCCRVRSDEEAWKIVHDSETFRSAISKFITIADYDLIFQHHS